MRIQPMIKRVRPTAMRVWKDKTVFQRLQFSNDVYVASDPSNTTGALCRIYPSITEEKEFDTSSMFHLTECFSKYSIARKGPTSDAGIQRPLDFTDVLHKSFQLKDDVLAELLLDFKKHLLAIQEVYDKIEGWLIEPVQHFNLFSAIEDTECLQFNHISKALGFESMCVPCQCHFKRHPESDECLRERCKQPFGGHDSTLSSYLECPKNGSDTGVFHCNQPVAFDVYKFTVVQKHRAFSLCKFHPNMEFKEEGSRFSVKFNLDNKDEEDRFYLFMELLRMVRKGDEM
jgi:hypothetical protein